MRYSIFDQRFSVQNLFKTTDKTSLNFVPLNLTNSHPARDRIGSNRHALRTVSMVNWMIDYKGNCSCCEELTKVLPLNKYRSFLKSTSTAYKIFIVICLTTFPPLGIVLLMMRLQDTKIIYACQECGQEIAFSELSAGAWWISLKECFGKPHYWSKKLSAEFLFSKNTKGTMLGPILGKSNNP